MDQIVPELLISSTTEETYNSIDDTPQPIDSDDKFLPNLFAKHSSQLNQSMKFHLGTLLYSQNEHKPLPHEIPFHSQSLPVENRHEDSFWKQSNQPNPEISLEYASVLESSSKPWDSTDLEFNDPNRLCFDVTQYGNGDTSLYEWCPLPTELRSDESQAINKALLCFLLCCQDEVCKKGKKILDNLKRSIQNYEDIDCKERLLLEFLLNHRRYCMELSCIAPGCQQPVNSLEDLINCIRKEHTNNLQYSNNDRFYKCSSNCWVNSPMEVNEKTMCSYPSANFINIYRKDGCWSKITLLNEDMQDILPLFLKVGRLSNHHNILPIEWIIDNGSISYCTEHYIEPLKYKLNLVKLNIKELILQLIEAALYLNSNEIAFLAWTTENVCYKHGRVMLGNFHMGSALFNDFDLGLIKCLLLPMIVPPELNSNNSVTLTKADVWGVCCLLYELLTNKVVHSDLLHLERHHVWQMLDKHGWKPQCPFTDKNLQSIFHQGWEEEPEHRISLSELKCKILNLSFSSYE